MAGVTRTAWLAATGGRMRVRRSFVVAGADAAPRASPSGRRRADRAGDRARRARRLPRRRYVRDAAADAVAARRADRLRSGFPASCPTCAAAASSSGALATSSSSRRRSPACCSSPGGSTWCSRCTPTPGRIRFRDHSGQSFTRYEGVWTLSERDGHAVVSYRAAGAAGVRRPRVPSHPSAQARRRAR